MNSWLTVTLVYHDDIFWPRKAILDGLAVLHKLKFFQEKVHHGDLQRITRFLAVNRQAIKRFPVTLAALYTSAACVVEIVNLSIGR